MAGAMAFRCWSEGYDRTLRPRPPAVATAAAGEGAWRHPACAQGGPDAAPAAARSTEPRHRAVGPEVSEPGGARGGGRAESRGARAGAAPPASAPWKPRPRPAAPAPP